MNPNDAILEVADPSHPLSNPVNVDLVNSAIDAANPNSSAQTLYKGIPLVASSAATQLWNGVGTLANLAIPFADPFKTDVKGDALLPFSGTHDYYLKHQEGIDFVGTVVGAVIPSTLGIKALKFAQAAGEVSGAARGTVGLFTNQAEAYYLNKAEGAIAAGLSPRMLQGASAAAGGFNFALEGIAAETATFAALNQSPMYDGVHDVGDFIGNVASAGGTFGVLGTAFKLARASGKTFYSEALGRNTTLSEVKNFTSQARQNAAYFEASNPMAGAKFQDPASLLGVDMKLLEKETKLQMGGTYESTGKSLGNTTDNKVATSTVTHGDDLSLAYKTGRVEDLTKLNPYPEGSALRNTLANTLEQDAKNSIVQSNIHKGKAIIAFTPQEDLRKFVSSSLDSFTPIQRDAILAKATKMEWATVKGTADKAVSFVDLKTGEIANSAQVLAHDMGIVTIPKSGANVQYAGKVVNFKSTEFADLSKLPVDEHNVAYHYVDNLVAKNSKAAVTDVISPTDLPKLDAYMKRVGGFSILDENGNAIKLVGTDATSTLESIKRQAAEAMFADKNITYAELNARLNTSDEFISRGTITEGNLYGATDFSKPSKAQITYSDGGRISNIWEVKGNTFQDARIRVMKETNARIAEQLLGVSSPMADINLAGFTGKDVLRGKVLSANPEFGSQEELLTYEGGRVAKSITDMAGVRSKAMLRVDNGLQRLGKGSRAMAELTSAIHMITSSAENMYLEGADIVTRAMVNGKRVSTVVASLYEPAAQEYLTAYSKLQQSIGIKKAVANRALGGRGFDEEALYFQPPHPADTKYRAFMVDKEGNVGMLYAGTEMDLAKKKLAVSNNHPELTLYTEESSDVYKQVMGEYVSALSTRGKLKIDSAMRSNGTLSNIFPTTDPLDFTRSIHAGLARSEKDIIHSAINLRYGQQLAEADYLAKSLNQPNGVYSKVYNTLTNSVDTTTPWAIFQGQTVKGIDHLVAMTWGSARGMLNNKLSIDQAEAADIASRFVQNKGINIFATPELWEMSGLRTFNGTAAKAIHETNNVMRAMQLSYDYINGLVQVAGFPILALPQVRAAMNNKGDTGVHLKVMHQAVKDLMNPDTREALLQRAINDGVVSEDMLKYFDMLDSHAGLVNATDSVDALRQATGVKQKISKVMDAIQTPTALAERYTALASYRMGELAYGIGKEGIQLNPLAVSAFAANFSRKVVGNYVAGQRPQIFQGVLGSAVGLFQTYQGTYFQQAARFLEKPDGVKNVAMMGGLQGAIFGAQSLPGFSAINHVIATNWNERHADFQSNLTTEEGAPSIAGIGNAFLYGSLSAGLGSALWTRGDVNPRIPLNGMPWNLENLSQYQYVKNILGAMGQWQDSISNGGSLTMSSAEAIAHANLNRPLTGIMEFLTGVHTTKGGMLETAVGNDLLSLATAMRLAGTRPLQEVIATAETYKMGMVKAEEQKHLSAVAYALRSRIMSSPDDAKDQAVIDEFAKRYSELGGNPKGFNKWFMSNVGKATTPRAQQFADKIKNSPYAQAYQDLANPEGLDMLKAPSKEELKAVLKTRNMEISQPKQ